MYYGLLAFAAAAPPGARMLPVSVQTRTNLSAWATRTPDRRLHVVLINKALSGGALIQVRLPLRPATTASVSRLLAPGSGARGGVSLGGRSFGNRTYSGRLRGRGAVSVIHMTGRSFTVPMPAATAAVLTIALPRNAGTVAQP